MLLSTTPVTYGKEVPGVGISIEPELDRETIFKKHSVDGQKMDALSAYQPEHDGWKVVRIKVGKYVYIVFVDIILHNCCISGGVTLLEPVTEHDIVIDFIFPYHHGTNAGTYCATY